MRMQSFPHHIGVAFFHGLTRVNVSLRLGLVGRGKTLGSVRAQEVVVDTSLAEVLEDFHDLTLGIVGIHSGNAFVGVLLQVKVTLAPLTFERGELGEVVEEIGD